MVTPEHLFTPLAYQELRVTTGEMTLYCYELHFDDAPELNMGAFDEALSVTIDAILDDHTDDAHIRELKETYQDILNARVRYEIQMFNAQDLKYLKHIASGGGSFNGTDTITGRRATSLRAWDEAIARRYAA